MARDARIGSYRLIRRIGAGGMGEVWLAEHAMLGRRAAIKVLHASFAARSDVVTRFFNEARAATAIADPGIVQIFDFGHHDDGSAYIVMELLDGETLDARWRRGGLDLADALRVMRQVASSLGAAHLRGIVHRDLKPENIFLVRDPEVPGGERAKILDFGIAKLAADPGLKTQTSVVMGTPTFMAPEQCRGAGSVDQRADVYSLGCVLFALATGRPPFVSEGTGELIAMHLREPAPRARTFAPHLPQAVDDLIACCLEKDPASRFASGAVLAAALAAVQTSCPTNPPVGAVATQPVHAIAPPPTAPVQGTVARPPGLAIPTTLSASAAAVATPRTRSRSWFAVGAITVLACLALATWRLTASGSGEHAVAAPSPPGAASIDVANVPDAGRSIDVATAEPDAGVTGPPADAGHDDAAARTTGDVDERRLTKPDPMRAESTKPSTEPEPTKPDPTKPDPTKRKPDATRPDSMNQRSTPDAPRPASTKAAADPTRPAPTKAAADPTRPAPTKAAADPTRPAPTKAAADPTRPAPTRPDPKPTDPDPTVPKPCNAPPGIPCER